MYIPCHACCPQIKRRESSFGTSKSCFGIWLSLNDGICVCLNPSPKSTVGQKDCTMTDAGGIWTLRHFHFFIKLQKDGKAEPASIILQASSIVDMRLLTWHVSPMAHLQKLFNLTLKPIDLNWADPRYQATHQLTCLNTLHDLSTWFYFGVQAFYWMLHLFIEGNLPTGQWL